MKYPFSADPSNDAKKNATKNRNKSGNITRSLSDKDMTNLKTNHLHHNRANPVMKTIKARKMWAMNPAALSAIVQHSSMVALSPDGPRVHPDFDQLVAVIDISEPSKLVEQCAKAANRACPKDTEELAIAVLRCIGLPIK